MGPPPPWQGMVCINSVFASYIISFAVPYILNAYLESGDKKIACCF